MVFFRPLINIIHPVVLGLPLCRLPSTFPCKNILAKSSLIHSNRFPTRRYRRNDIHTLLLVAGEHIASVNCNDDGDGCSTTTTTATSTGPTTGGGGGELTPSLRSLHEACTHLFACMVFVCAPLDHLYRYAKQRTQDSSMGVSPVQGAGPARPVAAQVTAWTSVFSSFTSDTTRLA